MPSPPYSLEVTQAYAEAQAEAKRAGVAPSSLHLLLALVDAPTRAATLFVRRGMHPDALRAALDETPAREAAGVFARVGERAAEVARNVGAAEVNALHVVVALSRLREADAPRALERAGHSLAHLRNVAVGQMTGTAPRRFLGLAGAARPLLAGSSRGGVVVCEAEAALQVEGQVHGRVAAGVEQRSATASVTQARDAKLAHGTSDARTDGTGQAYAASADPGGQAKGPAADDVGEARMTALAYDTQADDPKKRLSPAGAETQGAKAARAPTPTRAASTHVARAQPGPAAPAPAPAVVAAPAARPAPLPAPEGDVVPVDIGTLPLEEFAPALAECSIDLTARAVAGQLDQAIGRERELEALADVLGKRRANNPVLVGPPGVGKTAIVEGLAATWAEIDPSDGLAYDGRRIVALDTGAMVAGTQLRGSFSERMNAIKNEVAQADGHLVVFIDELHTLMGAGASGEGPQDAAGELKAALARGEFPCIGATTEDEFKRYIERDPALERRFTPIQVAEPSVEDAQTILRGALQPYQEHHRVTFAAEAVEAAVVLTHRFVTERKLPDKAFAALDLAGSRAHRRGKVVVDRAEVARVVHEWTQVPLERLVESDAQRFARAEGYLAERLVGHPHVVAAVAQALRRGFAGFNGKRPMGSFLFLGPTGVGKTEMVKILAEFVFGRRDSIVRFDMSELAEKHAVARLLGAQPGYVGYDEGGQLTEALRKRPFQIVLFDEVEKAHPDVLNVLLQLLDEGHLTDAQGRRISFANTLVVLTSNLGAQALDKCGSIGFGAEAGRARAGRNADPDALSSQDLARSHQVAEAARAQLTPELWSRIDEHLVFLPLSCAQVERIAAAQLETQRGVLGAERGVRLSWSEAVVGFLLRQGGFSTTTGARGLRQALQRHVEAPIAALILGGGLATGAEVHLDARKGEDRLHLRVRRTTDRQPPRKRD